MVFLRRTKLARLLLLLISAAIFVIFFLASCTPNKITPIGQSNYTQPYIPIDQSPKTETPNSPQVNALYENSWILTTKPFNGEQNVSQKTDISITFNQDMDISTLNPENITVMEGMHSSFITYMFNYQYDAKTRTLQIKFKNPESDYGPENGILVTVTGNVANAEHKKMGKNSEFGFSVAPD
ncbi:Ig-like domain-containing protein [Paradesulfitobacterium ferrireducens]|uniref:Ig-like domain-containing protein n=1 Tax=Paradesulfitobacterium ferrireducens TaxID=2816476 RepID=UPI001A8F7551|nr:Ig-like domain-containing protein [Paradesulfitobacterium ferrireducens]